LPDRILLFLSDLQRGIEFLMVLQGQILRLVFISERLFLIYVLI